jgi:2,3-bisphosphoglycerate-independent phosphoglycerate mutase
MLMILDGWGINPEPDGNAVAQARTPVLDGLLADYPKTELSCSGEAVGLPAGIMGNSEVGHMNIGAGRVVFQDLLRIDRAISDKSFFKNEALRAVMTRVREHGSVLHLMGLVSDGGVHSQLTHLFALLEMAKANRVPRTYVHAILDGRDTSPTGGVDYIRQLSGVIEALEYGTIVSVCGRYYAMDRDKRWPRVENAFRLYTRGEGEVEPEPVQAVKNAYDRGETDEFVKPICISPDQSETAGTVQDDDGIIFFNFRADRARQITSAFTDPTFKAFERNGRPHLCDYVTMTRYDETFDLPVAFPPVRLEDILGQVVSRNGLRQLRIAETEKYAHVTYFFNGGEETPFPNEDRCLIPSPRDVPTYDLKPEMSALEVTDEVLTRIGSGRYDFIVLNFANLDMVGHTGVIPAAIKACETVDACIGRIVAELKSKNIPLIITADHGNAEKMVDDNGSVHTAHTTHRVPLVLVDDSRINTELAAGSLGDIAPTILAIMGLPQPEKMTGRSLIAHP